MPPFPGMPYGPAPAWCFPVFEGTAYLCFLVCLIHAARRSTRGVIYLLGALAFGVVLEYVEVATGSYTYGRFWLMLGRPPLAIPLCIGAGWGIIMYTARLFTDSFRLPLLTSAALDTLLALNIDLSMDVVAYRLHMWHWYWNRAGLNPLTAQWFGIPYGNFVGWITVVFCYSAFSRLFEAKILRSGTSVLRSIAVALLALICSQAVLFTSETWIYIFLRNHLDLTSGIRLILFTIALLVLTILGFRKAQRPFLRIPAIATWIPCWFHLFFIACFISFRFYRENAAMTAVAVANILLGLAIHLYPWARRAKLTDNSEASYNSAAVAQ
jgi:hypothetical protein